MTTQTVNLEAEYVKIIDALWGGAVANNTVNNISAEVKDIMNDVILQIQTCSKRMLSVDVVFNIFYTTTDIPSLIVNIATLVVTGATTGTFADWFQVIKGNMVYRSCVNVAAANYRSAVELALMGL